MKARNIIVILMVLFVVSVAVNIWQASRVPTSHHSSSEETSAQLYTCGMHPNVIQEGPGTCPICGMNLTPMKTASTAASGERNILYWRAPMDPNYISDEPGKSPMGMDLVPVYENEVQGKVITVDPAVVQNIGVRTATVQRRNLSRTVETNGVVIVDESQDFGLDRKIIRQRNGTIYQQRRTTLGHLQSRVGHCAGGVFTRAERVSRFSDQFATAGSCGFGKPAQSRPRTFEILGYQRRPNRCAGIIR